ncbi:hypothetical protein SCLCIDRAFT_173600 [Scleroderma citrinum Foug A]|uniref:Uncharacterized protein n=1 Tax=Scleroderma citrinum Foug A TaxID=1036808 RepID=A0A0C3EDV9_9AGAM|nr:hypothetical protein SCLCIDRAFT_173600 [Scleroderma citrinum Foug A]
MERRRGAGRRTPALHLTRQLGVASDQGYIFPLYKNLSIGLWLIMASLWLFNVISNKAIRGRRLVHVDPSNESGTNH